MPLLHPHHVTLFSRKGLFTQSIWFTVPFFFFFILEGRSGRTIEPLMCGDIIFGSSLTILPKASQTEDLHGGLSLGAAGSNATFQNRAVGKHGRGAPAQQQGPCAVTTTKTVKEAPVITMQTQQLTLLRHEAPALPLHKAGAQTGFEQSRIQQSHLTLGKPIHPDCSTATDLRAGYVPRPKLRDREFSSQPNG